MARAVLITGGNRGDRQALLRQACELIGRHCGEVVRASAHYESAPWGFEAEEAFLNQVLEIETELSPEALLETIHRVEGLLGRDRTAERKVKAQSGQRYASRTMDIDVLLYDEIHIESPDLQIPHPRMGEREFVLRPLVELMPERKHPLTGETFRAMLDKLTESTAGAVHPDQK